MTSKGCVAIVAIAPADAADKLCIPVEYEFEVGGSSWARMRVSVKTVTKLECNLHTCLCFDSLIENYEEACIRCIS